MTKINRLFYLISMAGLLIFPLLSSAQSSETDPAYRLNVGEVLSIQFHMPTLPPPSYDLMALDFNLLPGHIGRVTAAPASASLFSGTSFIGTTVSSFPVDFYWRGVGSPFVASDPVAFPNGTEPATVDFSSFTSGTSTDGYIVVRLSEGYLTFDYPRLVFAESGTSGYGYSTDGQPFIDSFSISPIPEPETFALLLVGLGILGFAARRRSVC